MEDKVKKKKRNRLDVSVGRKGIEKKRPFLFQKGVKRPQVDKDDNSDITDSPPLKRICKRLGEEQFGLVIKPTPTNQLGIPDAGGKDGTAMVFRRRKKAAAKVKHQPQKSPQGTYNMEEGNFVAEKSRLMQLFNSANKQHSDLQQCDAVDSWDIVDIEPWGVYSSVIMTCTECGFKSDRTKLYEELHSGKRGRKSAVGNVRLQLMLQDTPIGPTEAQLIFAAIGVNPGSLSSMQRGAYRAALATENVNHEDMIKWRNVIRDVLKDRGVLSFNHISGAFDVRYNGSSLSNDVTPGPGATHGVGLLTESITSQQKCLGLDFQSTLCPNGARLRLQGLDIVCGDGPVEDRHPGCTATLPPGRHISEYVAGENIADELYGESGLIVTHLVTDSDGTGRDAFKAVNEKNDATLPELCWYKDLMHVGWNMKQKIKKHKFSAGAFGLKQNGDSWNFKERKECVKALATEVQDRTAITLKNAIEYFKGDLAKLKKNAGKLTHYMIQCYHGNHKPCTSSPIAKLTGCKGGYFSSSSSLKAQKITSLNLNMKDQCFLESVINMKLGEDSVGFFSRRLTTSRCESMNRAMSKSAPKNRPFPQTGKGRVHSSVLRQNNTFQEAFSKKCEAMQCPIKEGEVWDKIVSQYQRKRKLTYRNQQKPSAKARRRARKQQRRSDYYHQRTRVTNKGDYVKNQLDIEHAAKNTAVERLVTRVNSDGASTSMEVDIRTAAVRVRRTKAAIKDWKEHQESSIKQHDEMVDKKKETKKKMKKSAKNRCAMKTAARKERVAIHGDHSYGK